MKMVPAWYGITEATAEASHVRLTPVQAGSQNPGVDPYALVQLLWRDEALSVLREFGLERGVKSKPRAAIWRRLADSRPIEELRSIVRHRLRHRTNWRDARESGREE